MKNRILQKRIVSLYTFFAILVGMVAAILPTLVSADPTPAADGEIEDFSYQTMTGTDVKDTVKTDLRFLFSVGSLAYYGGLFKGIVPCLAITFTAGWFLRYIPLNGWLGFAVCIAALVLVYGVSMLLFGFNKYEKGLIGSIIKDLSEGQTI